MRYLPPAAFFALVLVAAGLALVELYRLHFHGRPATMAIAVGLVNAGLLLTHMQWPDVFSLHSVLAWIIGATLLFYLLSAHDLNQSLVDVSVLVFGSAIHRVYDGASLADACTPGRDLSDFFCRAGHVGRRYRRLLCRDQHGPHTHLRRRSVHRKQ